MTKPSLLFICTHNAGRSALAAGLARHQAQGRAEVGSAGAAPADGPSDVTIASLAEFGIDDSGHTPTEVTEELVRNAPIVVSMKPGLDLPQVDGSPMKPGISPTRKVGTSKQSARSETTSMPASRIFCAG